MAILLGGDGVDAEVVVGPNVVTDGLIFYMDPANSDSIGIIANGPLANNAEVDYLYNLVSTGSINIPATYTLPAYQTSNNGILFLGQGNTAAQNTKGNFEPYVGMGFLATFDIWVKIKPSNTEADWLYGKNTGNETNVYTGNVSILSLDTSATTLTISIDTSRYNSVITSLSKNEWYNIVSVLNGASSKLYINGVEALPSVQGTWFKGTSQQIGYSALYLGGLSRTVADGYLGPLKMYNKNLSSQEVFQNYNTMKSRYII